MKEFTNTYNFGVSREVGKSLTSESKLLDVRPSGANLRQA